MPRILALLALVASLGTTSVAATLTPFSPVGPIGPAPYGVSAFRVAPAPNGEAVALWSSNGVYGGAYASRIGADGQLLDSIGLPFASGFVRSVDGAPTSAGTVIAWDDNATAHLRLLRNDGTFGETSEFGGCGDLRVVSGGDRVLILSGGFCNGATATITDAVGNIVVDGVALASGDPIYRLAAASEPDAFLVVFEGSPDAAGHRTIYGRRVDHDGHTGSPFLIAAVPNVVSVDAVFDGTNDLIVWTEIGGRLQGVTVAPGSTTASAPALLEDDADHTVALSSGFGQTWLVYSASGNHTNAVPLTNGTPTSQPRSLGSAFVSSAAPAPYGVLVGLSNLGGSVVAVTPTTVASPQLVTRSAALQIDAAIATDGTTRVAVYTSTVGVFATTLRADGTPTEPVKLSEHGTAPAIARGDGAYLAAWIESTATPEGHAGPAYVHTMRLGDAGQPLEATPTTIASTRLLLIETRIAFGGGEWLVVWSGADYTSRTVEGARVSSAGVPRDPAPLTIAPNADAPDAAWNGHAFVVVWRNYVSLLALFGAQMTSIGGAAVDPSSGAAGIAQQLTPSYMSGTRYSPSGEGVDAPKIAVAAGRTLVTWREAHVIRPETRQELRGLFLGPDAFDVARAAQAPGRRRAARASAGGFVIADGSTGLHVVQFDGTRFVVLWATSLDVVTSSATRADIDLDGNVAAPTTVTTFQAGTLQDAIVQQSGVTLALALETTDPPYGPTTRLFWWQ